MLGRWPRSHLLAATWAAIALASALLWLAVATWQYLHPADLPSLLGDTAPMALATVAGFAAWLNDVAQREDAGPLRFASAAS